MMRRAKGIGVRGFRLASLVLPTLLLPFGCASATGELTDEPAGSAVEELNAAGALVGVELKSRVGVVLDEIPSALRDRAAAYYLSQPNSFWVARAKQQIRFTNYRLIYRDFFYDESENKRMLSLPPEEVWNIKLESAKPKRVVTADGHDAVQIAYTLSSTIVTDCESPGAAEAKLKKVGGVWKEPFNLPLDPEFVFQRTGWACMDEDGYPLNTAESENAHQLFDQSCEVETPDTASCHLSEYPEKSCVDALADHVGRIDTAVRFERLAYSKAAADKVRVGKFSQAKSPDLSVLGENLGNNWIEYRYIPEDSCAIQEQCVGGSGWRRLMLFDASIKNSGAQPLSVGSVEEGSPPRDHNMFEFSACHEHFHFRHYGDFSYGKSVGDKRAFCVESTDRYFNNEQTPIVHDFSCENQGVAVGWGDTYIAGVECNWVDITDRVIPAAGVDDSLRFEVNPDKFLCEGQPVLDKQGNPLYTTTDYVTEDGQPVGKPVCDFAAGYASNNVGTSPVHVNAKGGLVTRACSRKQAGPLRDCGFIDQVDSASCTPGKKVKLTCSVANGKPSQVLRVCESSKQLGGTDCQFAESLANTSVSDTETNVTFTCPAKRSSSEPGGAYALYTAPVLPTDSSAIVTCKPR